MADRRCPYCGELVPSTSITCPKCYRKIPSEPEPVRKETDGRKNEGRRRYSPRIAMLLSLIPGLFGLLGLGLIYRNPRQKRGYVALLLGLYFFIAAVMFTFPLFTIFLAVPCWILYVLGYLGCLALVTMDGLTVRMF